MARTDTLEHYLTDVADAIRSKTGESGTIQASNFDALISNIPIEEETVKFYDSLDGTMLYSYTPSEFLELTELPNVPTHIGYTAYGWNYTLSDAKSFVESFGELEISCDYKNINDFYIKFIIDENLPSLTRFRLYFKSEISNIEIDIMYNSTTYTRTLYPDSTSSLAINIQNSGSYEIRIYRNSQISENDHIIMGIEGGTTYSGLIVDPNNIEGNAFGSYIKEVHVPEWIKFNNYSFSCSGLQHISFDNYDGYINEGLFYNCTHLKQITINNLNIANYAFYNCTLLEKIFLNSDTDYINIGEHCFYNTKLDKVYTKKNGNIVGIIKVNKT